MTNTTLPVGAIAQGLFDLMGITYPPTDERPLGVIETPYGYGDVETSDVNGCGFSKIGDVLSIDWGFIPLVFISLQGSTYDMAGPKLSREGLTFRVHYVADNRDTTLTASPLGDGSPISVVIQRASVLRNLIDAGWQELGTGFRTNSVVGRVTEDNRFSQTFDAENRMRVAASFDVVVRLMWGLP